MASPPIPGEGTALPSNPGLGTPGGWGSPQSVSVRDFSGRFTVGGVGFAWQGLEGVMALPDVVEARLDAAIWAAVETLAHEMEEYAQANAPWQDHTGDARAGLHAVTTHDIRGRFRITLGYDVDYGVYLETANGGEFAIVGPTVEHFAPDLIVAVMDNYRGWRK